MAEQRSRTPSSEDYGIHWFRRDLRLEGNPALSRNWAAHSGRVVGVFSFDRAFLSRPDFSANRFGFFLLTLEKLREEMRARGGDLLFLDEGPTTAFPSLLAALKSHALGLPKTVSWNRDYEPFARMRDAKLHEVFERDFGVQTLTERDHLLIEPTELLKDEKGGTYQVFTPFSKKWLALFSTPEMNARMREVGAGLKAGAPEFRLTWPSEFGKQDALAKFLAANRSRVASEVCDAFPKPGHLAAREALKKFRDHHLKAYDTARDIPSLPGTSRMSIYLKNGSITVPQIIALLKLAPAGNAESATKYLKELIWREFYYHILYHHPSVETEPFLNQYRKLKWENDRFLFQAWCEGRTGYPIIDAGMRELNATGWMHNRVRMIAASFLTKDLLIDYRWGERYFMEKLLDGDLAPNNGSWQWAASTGCDPQPYFRIFNPTSQGERFDPHGEYVMKWVPELRDRPLVRGKFDHEPKNPIVDHAIQRERALALYREARG